MLILTIYVTLLDKGKGGLESTPRADILETVQDLLILAVLLGKKRQSMEKRGDEGSTTCTSFTSYTPFLGSFFSVYPFFFSSVLFLPFFMCFALLLAWNFLSHSY